MNFSDDPDAEMGETINMALCMVALVVVACGTGGIKPGFSKQDFSKNIRKTNSALTKITRN